MFSNLSVHRAQLASTSSQCKQRHYHISTKDQFRRILTFFNAIKSSLLLWTIYLHVALFSLHFTPSNTSIVLRRDVRIDDKEQSSNFTEKERISDKIPILASNNLNDLMFANSTPSKCPPCYTCPPTSEPNLAPLQINHYLLTFFISFVIGCLLMAFICATCCVAGTNKRTGKSRKTYQFTKETESVGSPRNRNSNLPGMLESSKTESQFSDVSHHSIKVDLLQDRKMPKGVKVGKESKRRLIVKQSGKRSLKSEMP